MNPAMCFVGWDGRPSVVGELKEGALQLCGGWAVGVLRAGRCLCEVGDRGRRLWCWLVMCACLFQD